MRASLPICLVQEPRCRRWHPGNPATQLSQAFSLSLSLACHLLPGAPSVAWTSVRRRNPADAPGSPLAPEARHASRRHLVRGPPTRTRGRRIERERESSDRRGRRTSIGVRILFSVLNANRCRSVVRPALAGGRTRRAARDERRGRERGRDREEERKEGGKEVRKRCASAVSVREDGRQQQHSHPEVSIGLRRHDWK